MTAAAPVGALVYYPILPQARQLPRGVFAEGERYEHHQGDSKKAFDWFAALLRLGRNQRKAGQTCT